MDDKTKTDKIKQLLNLCISLGERFEKLTEQNLREHMLALKEQAVEIRGGSTFQLIPTLDLLTRLVCVEGKYDHYYFCDLELQEGFWTVKMWRRERRSFRHFENADLATALIEAYEYCLKN